KVLKSSNGPHVQNNQTEGGEAKKSDGDSEEVASDDGVAVLLQVKLFRFVKFFIAHDKKYSTMAADDRPDMPLKMWLVRAGTFNSAYTPPRKTTINRVSRVAGSGTGMNGGCVRT